MVTGRRSYARLMRPGMNRRDFLKLSGAGVASATLLGACGGFSGGESESSGKLIFTHGREDSGALDTLIKQFNDQNKGKIEVEWRRAPSDTGAYFDQLRTQLEAGGGDIDVISGDVIWPIQFGFNGWIEDLSDLFTEEMQQGFLSGPLEANVYQGKIYGVPWFTDAGMLYYRKDLLSKSGFKAPPKTYEELFAMAKKVQADSGVKTGFSFQGAKYEGGVCDGCEFIWGNGGLIQAADNEDEITIDSPEAAGGLETERSTVEEGITPDAVVTYTELESEAPFLNDDAVFMRNWPYIIGLVTAGEAKIKADQFGVAPLPVGPDGDTGYSTLGGWNLFINAASAKKDQAWEFIQFMASEEAAKVRATMGGYLPPIASLYQDAEVRQKAPSVPLAEQISDLIRPRPPSPFYSDMSLEMQEQFNDSLKGDVTPDEAVSTLQTDLQAIIDEGTK
jgi:multiple sugar transport system substrate-binding protein